MQSVKGPGPGVTFGILEHRARLVVWCFILTVVACSDRSHAVDAKSAIYEVTVPLITIEGHDTTAACPKCRIVLDSITTIGSEADSVVPLDPTNIVEGSDQSFYVTRMSEAARVGVYNWNGQLVRLLGRSGEGPGELRSAASVAAASDSFLAVLDISRILWYPLPAGKPITLVLSSPMAEFRTIALPGRGLVVAVEQGLPGRAFAFVSASGERKSFGDSVKIRAQVGAGYVPYWLAAVSKDRFFAMPWYNEARIDEWETSGRLLRRYRLPAPWFIPYGLGPLQELEQVGIRGTRIAISGGVWLDAAGRLWAITNVPDPRWRTRSDTGIRDERGGRHAQNWGFDRREVLDAIVAVYALTDTSVTLIASARFAMPLSRFLSDSVVVERQYVDREFIGFNLFRFRLVGHTMGTGGRE